MCHNAHPLLFLARITRINTVFCECKHLFIREIRVIRA